MEYSEEEKKSIEILEKINKFAEEFNICFCTEKILNVIKEQRKEIEKSYLQGFNDSEEKYNTVIAENMKLKSELAKKDKCIMKLKNLNKRLMKKR